MTLFNMKENIKYLTSSRSRLSLEHLCPQWAKKLKSGLDEQDIRILAHDSKFCIVGEAWKYSGQHTGYYIAPLIPFIGCWRCIKFGQEMGNIAKTYGKSCANKLYPIINLFLDHWNTQHTNINK
jgi:hypothetical protein